MKIKSVFIYILIFSLCFAVFSQSYSELYLYLADQGFENVKITTVANNTVLIEYENRVFRNDLLAAGVVVALVADADAKTSAVIIVPLNKGVPLCEITINTAAYKKYIGGDIGKIEFASSLLFEKIDKKRKLGKRFKLFDKNTSSFRKLDITFQPGTRVHLGNYDDRYKLSFDLMPELSTSLWKGNTILAQILIPIHDEIGLYTNEVRLSRFIVNQVFNLPFSGLCSLNAGAFNPDRWGLSAEICYYIYNKHFLIGSKIDYTGFLLYQNSRWNFSKLGKTTNQTYCYYFFNNIDIAVGINYSRYLMGDSGWLGELSRTFGETKVGVYFAKTEIDKFGGFRFRIPLRPVKRTKPNIVRLNIPPFYDLSYKASNVTYTFGAPIETGVVIKGGLNLLDFNKNMTPTYIRNNIDMWLSAAKFVQKHQ
jgi:hypothetical protein